jgi:hypothetical protein
MTNPFSFFSAGLQKGFTGESVFQPVTRAGFSLHSSHFEENGNIYHDEWAGSQSGGGQELVKVGGQVFTRTYAGGAIPAAALQALGISKKDIMAYLFTCIASFGEKMRLQTNLPRQVEGDWSYEYRVLEKNDAISMTVGKEEILYKNALVFTHVFVMCPVE